MGGRLRDGKNVLVNFLDSLDAETREGVWILVGFMWHITVIDVSYIFVENMLLVIHGFTRWFYIIMEATREVIKRVSIA